MSRARRWLRRGVVGGVGLASVFVSLVTSVGWFISGPVHTGPVSDHFDGDVFVNTEDTPMPNLARGLRMLREGRGSTWEQRSVAPQPPPPERVHGASMRATFVNHATVLVQHDGVNVLTDPIWSERCSAVQWAGPARHHEPGVSLEDLPPIDVVLISHNHYDHLDEGTLRTLAQRDDPVLVVPLGNGPLARDLGFPEVIELDWRQTVSARGLQITGEEVRHFSSRGLFDRNRTLWMGFSVEGKEAGRWYFAGDTGFGKHFADTGRARGPFRLALLPIGAYAPRWFMGPIHMDPDQAVQAHLAVGARQSIGVHFGTFQLTREAQDAPVEELAEARATHGVADDAFVALLPGQGMDVR